MIRIIHPIVFLFILISVAQSQTVDEYFQEGVIKFDSGNYSGAIEDYNKAIANDPNVAEFYHNRGLAKSKLGDKIGALQDHNKAIEIDPNFAEAYYSRGADKKELGDTKGAIEDLSKAIEIDPSLAKAYLMRGMGKLLDFKDYFGAIWDCNKAIELKLDTQHGIVDMPYLCRGMAKVSLNFPKEAIQDLNEAIKLNSNRPLTYLSRGQANLKLDRKTEACFDFSKALELGMSSVEGIVKKYCNQ